MTVYISDSFLGFQEFQARGQFDGSMRPLGQNAGSMLALGTESLAVQRRGKTTAEMLDDLSDQDTCVIRSQSQPLHLAAQFLRKKLERVPEGATVLAHGKAALDLIDCLIRYPETQYKVGRLICVQAPIWGTPLADFLTGHPLARLMLSGICKLQKFSMEAMEELTELNRQVYMILNQNKIQKLMVSVEIITVGSSFSWKQKPRNWQQRVSQYLSQMIWTASGPHDGLVPERSTRISNESHLHFSELTHLGAVKISDDLVHLNQAVRAELGTKLSGPSGYPHLSLLARPVEHSAEGPIHL